MTNLKPDLLNYSFIESQQLEWFHLEIISLISIHVQQTWTEKNGQIYWTKPFSKILSKTVMMFVRAKIYHQNIFIN